MVGDSVVQDVIVMAFRKRLRLRGYIQISFKRLRPDLYLVSAVEPLAGFGVQLEMSLLDMHNAIR